MSGVFFHLRLLAMTALLPVAYGRTDTGETLQQRADMGAHGYVSRTKVKPPQPRELQEDTCSETTLFVDSRIEDLQIPVGGCYEASAVSANGYPSYVLNGQELVEGATWLFVTSDLYWKIAVVQEVDDSTGGVISADTICWTSSYTAGDVSGPTDSLLDGDWTCTYFQNGVTQYQVPADFTAVECGCAGKSLSSESDADGDGGGFSSTTIAIVTLVCLGVLLASLCAGVFLVRARRAKKVDNSDPSMQEQKSTI